MPASRTKPEVVPVSADAVPAIFRETDRWLCWSWVWNAQKEDWDKPPKNPYNGKNASSTNPLHWTDLSTALAAHQAGKFDGVGFALGEDKSRNVNFSGVDLDDCVEGGVVHASAVYLANLLSSYTELSPSGAGIKVFTLGKLPPGRRSARDECGIEMYDSGRYFTFTGRRLDWSPTEVFERTAALADLWTQTFFERPAGRSRLPDREIALSALNSLDARLAVGYGDWLAVGMALHSVADDLLAAWDQWSRSCPEKYAEGACAAKWRGFGKKSGLTLGSLIWWAKANGWVYPSDSLSPAKAGPATTNGTATHAAVTALGRSPASCDDDDHMGDGLTSTDGAGLWELFEDDGEPMNYYLRSPIWKDSPRLKDGFVRLTSEQLYEWRLLRKAAMTQSGVHVRKDKPNKPVWDGRGGPQLLNRLMSAVQKRTRATDFHRVLKAAEYILDVAEFYPVLAGEEATKPRSDIYRTEDGAVCFKVLHIAAIAKKNAPSITSTDISEAAENYGSLFTPRTGGKRPRYWRFNAQQIQKIEEEIAARQTSATMNGSRSGEEPRSQQSLS